MLKAGGARLEALEVISRSFDEGGVKLRVISIFVMVDAITIDKLTNCATYVVNMIGPRMNPCGTPELA